MAMPSEDQGTTIASETASSSQSSEATAVAASPDANSDFDDDINTNNDLPTAKTIAQCDGMVLLDEHGKSRTFGSLYTGTDSARRVMIIFVRHFFCGNCQEYLRTLSKSVTPTDLLALPVTTSIIVIGCGDPSLIAQYRQRTGTQFPIYADPTRALYDTLGMTKTLEMGARPEYQRSGNAWLIVRSLFQELAHIPTGKMLKGGDFRQVGGEFLFEPMDLVGLLREDERAGDGNQLAGGIRAAEKGVTWCHRMRNTRDHAEIPELREVLGLRGDGKLGNDKRRISVATKQRKGSGASRMAVAVQPVTAEV